VIPETHVDGTPHVTPVWVDHEDREYVLVNTARGRRRERNIRRDPKVGVSVLDPDDPTATSPSAARRS